ncbi:MAG: aminoacyl-tRNA hydrolase [Actinomycetota bacterium]|nr:aminoacyl-tRNA hydrolase [Actinomycetota bacterium]MDA3013312.1 aminoacyl-tRNA hydrolase [Actinomycetota bacterium]
MTQESNKLLYVGLWNPQVQYQNTRHNIGADTLFSFAKKYSIELKDDISGIFKLGTMDLEDVDLNILIPMVSMNVSGKAIKNYLKKYNLELTNLLVLHDDIDLPFGKLRIKSGSSDGGHNGIKSINTNLGTNEYFRFKIGLGRPPLKVDPADYVLSKFYTDEREEVEFLIEDSLDILFQFLSDRDVAIKAASERRIIDVV